MSIVVTHFGVHRTSENVVYLQQGGKGANFIRLPEASPFEVRPLIKLPCPHKIHTDVPLPDLENWAGFMEIFSDPLVRHFLPIPKDREDFIPFLAFDDPMLLILLSKLSSPTQPLVQRFDDFKLKGQLAITNIGPIVLTDIKPHHQEEMEKLASVASRSPRKLILAGDYNMVITSPMKRISTKLGEIDQAMLYSLPMETLGAVSLRRWARDEQVNAPWHRPST